ncbi:hypothetical protein [Martelella mediterranea]|uniref:Uncharacterized protein n=1 Tax=Martelella mediterranea TaxID=293089 RepID=A0A4R3NP37_9HYPH|nr:hypothetical protein [Martelella mediterranea]TCT37683.1 hypothetical protein EDC90_101773 [Martelella mediterranea]
MMAFLSGLFSRKTAPWLLAAVLIAFGGVSARMAVGKVSDLIDDRVVAARDERDAHWKAKLAASNLEVIRLEKALSEQVLETDRQIKAAENAAKDQLRTMEKANAALPGGDACGLGPDRVRLLPR